MSTMEPERDSIESQEFDSQLINLMMLNGPSFPTNVERFTVSTNFGLLNNWLTQPGPSCAAVSVASCINSIWGLKRDDPTRVRGSHILPMFHVSHRDTTAVLARKVANSIGVHISKLAPIETAYAMAAARANCHHGSKASAKGLSLFSLLLIATETLVSPPDEVPASATGEPWRVSSPVNQSEVQHLSPAGLGTPGSHVAPTDAARLPEGTDSSPTDAPQTASPTDALPPYPSAAASAPLAHNDRPLPTAAVAPLSHGAVAARLAARLRAEGVVRRPPGGIHGCADADDADGAPAAQPQTPGSDDGGESGADGEASDDPQSPNGVSAATVAAAPTVASSAGLPPLPRGDCTAGAVDPLLIPPDSGRGVPHDALPRVRSTTSGAASAPPRRASLIQGTHPDPAGDADAKANPAAPDAGGAPPRGGCLVEIGAFGAPRRRKPAAKRPVAADSCGDASVALSPSAPPQPGRGGAWRSSAPPGQAPPPIGGRGRGAARGGGLRPQSLSHTSPPCPPSRSPTAAAAPPAVARPPAALSATSSAAAVAASDAAQPTLTEDNWTDSTFLYDIHKWLRAANSAAYFRRTPPSTGPVGNQLVQAAVATFPGLTTDVIIHINAVCSAGCKVPKLDRGSLPDLPTQDAAWAAVETAFNAPHSVLLSHHVNHYCPVYAIRSYTVPRGALGVPAWARAAPRTRSAIAHNPLRPRIFCMSEARDSVGGKARAASVTAAVTAGRGGGSCAWCGIEGPLVAEAIAVRAAAVAVGAHVPAPATLSADDGSAPTADAPACAMSAVDSAQPTEGEDPAAQQPQATAETPLPDDLSICVYALASVPAIGCGVPRLCHDCVVGGGAVDPCGPLGPLSAALVAAASARGEAALPEDAAEADAAVERAVTDIASGQPDDLADPADTADSPLCPIPADGPSGAEVQACQRRPGMVRRPRSARSIVARSTRALRAFPAVVRRADGTGVVREMLTARSGQRPSAWVPFTEMLAIYCQWAGYQLLRVRAIGGTCSPADSWPYYVRPPPFAGKNAKPRSPSACDDVSVVTARADWQYDLDKEYFNKVYGLDA